MSALGSFNEYIGSKKNSFATAFSGLVHLKVKLPAAVVRALVSSKTMRNWRISKFSLRRLQFGGQWNGQ